MESTGSGCEYGPDFQLGSETRIQIICKPKIIGSYVVLFSAIAGSCSLPCGVKPHSPPSQFPHNRS